MTDNSKLIKAIENATQPPNGYALDYIRLDDVSWKVIIEALKGQSSTPEQMWEKFIERLALEQPLGKKGEIVPHQNLLGSVKAYKRIFLAAQEPLPPATGPMFLEGMAPKEEETK